MIDLRRLSQAVLLPLYGAIQRTGFLDTRPGQWLFERAYAIYKRRLEAGDAHALRRFVRPGTIVVDVGANIGFFTSQFARWVSHGGRVLALEPEVANLARLRQRLADEGLDGVVDIVPAAASDTTGSVLLEINPRHPGDHRIGPRGIPVESTTLDHLVAARGWPVISLIKIDVQGAEAQVIAGAQLILQRFRPALYVEIDDGNLRAYGSSAGGLLDILAAYGYVVANGRAHRLAPISRDRILESAKSGYVDVLFVAD